MILNTAAVLMSLIATFYILMFYFSWKIMKGIVYAIMFQTPDASFARIKEYMIEYMGYRKMWVSAALTSVPLPPFKTDETMEVLDRIHEENPDIGFVDVNLHLWLDAMERLNEIVRYVDEVSGEDRWRINYTKPRSLYRMSQYSKSKNKRSTFKPNTGPQPAHG